MSASQGLKFRSPFSNCALSAFKPFEPDTKSQHGYQSSAQQTPGPGAVPSVQPNVPSSYCGAGAAHLSRGQSPDIGYVSLEHPSRTSSYVSQVSMQFGDFDQMTPSREIQTRGRTNYHEQHSNAGHSDSTSNSGVASHRSSKSSVHSFDCIRNKSWMSMRSGSVFDVVSAPPRTPSDNGANVSDNGANVYSKVTNFPKGVDPTSETTMKQSRKSGTTMSAARDSNLSISDLRNILMIKETELRMMRETMSKNETAILQVFEDKKRKWQMEVSERKKDWESQLRAVENKAWKAEQLLQFQVAKLHQENKRLLVQADELSGDKKCLSERCHQLELELGGLKADMRGLLADFSSMNQVRSSSSIDADRYKIDSNYASVPPHSSPNSPLGYTAALGSSEAVTIETNPRQKRRFQGVAMDALDASISKPLELQRELDRTRREAESCRLEFEQEKQNWKAEKEKVVDYQKRLQLGYLQVLHKNRLLELDIQQLTGEMAAIDIKQLSMEENQPSRATDDGSLH